MDDDELRPLAPDTCEIREALLAAIRSDHPCDDDSCPIAVAARNGFVGSAAFLLGGASDPLPALEAFSAVHGRLPTRTDHVWDWDEWTSFAAALVRPCERCGTVNYADAWDVDRCGKCGGPIADDAPGTAEGAV